MGCGEIEIVDWIRNRFVAFLGTCRILRLELNPLAGFDSIAYSCGFTGGGRVLLRQFDCPDNLDELIVLGVLGDVVGPPWRSLDGDQRGMLVDAIVSGHVPPDDENDSLFEAITLFDNIIALMRPDLVKRFPPKTPGAPLYVH